MSTLEQIIGRTTSKISEGNFKSMERDGGWEKGEKRMINYMITQS